MWNCVLDLASPDVPETVTPVDSEKTQNWKKSLKNKNSGLLNIHKRRKKGFIKKTLVFQNWALIFSKLGPEVCANLRAKILYALFSRSKNSQKSAQICA